MTLKRHDTQIIRQQFPLRNSVQIHKNPLIRQYNLYGPYSFNDDNEKTKVERSKSRSLKGSSIFSSIIKQVKNQIKAISNKTQLFLDFNTEKNQLKKGTLIINMEFLKYNLQLNGVKQSLQSNKINKNNKPLKMIISKSTLSVEDQFMVKKSYPINLHSIQQKQILKVILSECHILNKLIINGKQVTIINEQNYKLNQNTQCCQFNPWKLIQNSKILLKDKLLQLRPKSSIQWNLTQPKQDIMHLKETATNKQNQLIKKQINLGLKFSEKSTSKKAIISVRELRSKLSTSQSQKCLYPFINVFSQQPKSYKPLMKSCQLVNSNKKNVKNIEFEPIQECNSVRSKSSFSSLKQKNDYFLMSESQRKRSINRNIHFQQNSQHNQQNYHNPHNHKEYNHKQLEMHPINQRRNDRINVQNQYGIN